MSAAAFKVWFLYCLRFFFYCSGALRDLHSFPTRRSSDLKPAATLSTSRRSRRATPASRSPSPAGVGGAVQQGRAVRSEEHTSELQSRFDLVCRLLLEKKNRCASG